MNSPTKPHTGSATHLTTPQAVRHSPKLRLAIKLRVEQGIVITDACARAGISEAGWHKAMARPAVRDLYEQTQLQFVQTIDRRREGYKARAIEVAADIMERGLSEASRMKAVEFLAGEGRQPLVNVSINRHAEPASGYSYRRPIDTPSAVEDAQVIEDDGQSGNADAID
jgi:hypothetical protein